MREEVARDLSKSSEDFMRLVWPVIGAGFGRPIPVEAVTATDFAKELDQRAGIDMWLVGTDENMRGLASRVQWTDRSWETFTVRLQRMNGNGHPVEYEKRSTQIATPGTVWPHYTVQAYVTKDRTRLISAAIVRTVDVISAVHNGIGYEKNNDRERNRVRFWVVPWRHWQQSRLPMAKWPTGSGAA